MIVASQLNPAAITADQYGEILVADFGEGKIYGVEFSEYDDANWKSLAEASYESLLSARREGITSTKLEIDQIMSSRRWRWTEPVMDIVNFVRGIFGTIPP